MDLQALHDALIEMVRTWIRTDAEIRGVPYGFIVRDLHHPLSEDTNLVWVDRAPEGGVDRIQRDLEAAFRGTDVRHRFVLFADPQEAYEHQDAFVAATFQAEAELVMAKVGLPSCIVNPDVTVRAVGTEAPEDAYRRIQLAIHDESGRSPEEARQVYAAERARGAAVGEHAYIAYLRDEPAGGYTVWPRGRFALIGNVATLPAFRMQGVGRTMIFDACRRATNARCEYALLTTDRFDTPQAMYKTLGFEPVGELRGFLRVPV